MATFWMGNSNVVEGNNKVVSQQTNGTNHEANISYLEFDRTPWQRMAGINIEYVYVGYRRSQKQVRDILKRNLRNWREWVLHYIPARSH